MLRLLLLYKLLFAFPVLTIGEVVLKDRAVFRIDGRIYFESDLGPIYKVYQSFDCIEANSFNKVMGKVELTENSTWNNKALRKIMTFEKLRKFIRNENLGDLKLKVKLRQQKKCLSIPKEVLKIESYMRQRFFPENKAIMDLEFKSFKKDNQYKKETDLKKAFIDYQQIKRKESQKLFINSLLKKAESFEFFHD
jgi:hypothetical protein